MVQRNKEAGKMLAILDGFRAATSTFSVHGATSAPVTTPGFRNRYLVVTPHSLRRST
jgi:hypothetical protein